mmetsp:Transcript_6667/g.14641  ORF Transcript_6667/g.14641 Transcript_6667/m.14641 type:complete len:315 (-) Transcript_6667:149-1093(-)
MSAEITTKRPVPGDGSSTPTAKRARSSQNKLSGSTYAGRRPVHMSVCSPPFRSCHLTMLKSLYIASTGSGDNKNTDTVSSASSKSVDNAVDSSVWDRIDVFLAKCDDLAVGRSKARTSRGVYESAVDILKNSDVIIHSASGVGPSHPTHSSALSTPLSVRSVTTPMRSVGVDTGTLDATSSQHNQQAPVNSWALLSSLLGRKSAAADREAKVIAKPFEPLVCAVKEKMAELQIIRKGIIEERYLKEQNITAVRLAASSNDGTSAAGVDIDALRDPIPTKALMDAEEKDAVATLECKLCLWHLLLHSLQKTVGHY